MATTKGQAIAAPQIFTSDPIEQGYAKQILDPDTGGLAYGLLLGARADRATHQDTYLNALRESNIMASRLAQQEMDQEILKEYIKSAAEQANAGIDPSTMRGSGRLYINPSDPLTRQPSALSRDKKAAEAEHLRAQAATAGQAGADTITYTQDVGSSGVRGDYRVVVKSRDPNRARILNEQALTGGTTGPPPPNTVVKNPDGSVRTKTTAEMRADARDAALITQRLNEKDARYRSGT